MPLTRSSKASMLMLKWRNRGFVCVSKALWTEDEVLDEVLSPDEVADREE